MLDQEDEGTRIGVWVALSVVFVVVVGLIGGLVLRQLHGKAGAPAAAVSASASATAGVADAAVVAEFIEVPLDGDVAGTLYFAVGQTTLPEGSEPVVFKLVVAVQDEPKRKVVLSGFHDATGAADVNARIARDRALALRAALIAEGVDPSRIVLRKPEVTLGDADPIEARRVEARLVE
ncbi:OmpA family protein [Piscinibacter sakaiensis]|uniref:Cytochrome c oxidase polypeptide II n=1 Tax=Piscinibacter sakaiensis TaxID=1547922 RepID=A0A0K8P9E6_PISS1|nr:OmpA family protein [Piscinibacter sakaiensis]GAP38805.1 cytochrome c oxidase polypeptide II [Piscinibacter sakaiensis]